MISTSSESPPSHSVRTRPELLAPAGDWEAMRAAVANGADAVYFGLSNFNARHRAQNFIIEELPDVMEYLHAHNVRGFVTLNTLIFSDELPEAMQLVRDIAAARVDAVIVQDLGLARLIQRTCPALHVHGSTQMTLTEPLGIAFVARLGIQRVVLARELSVSEIQKITRATNTPVEVFVHGALCVSYSGQCLTSEALGGRSANRGQCAQACRLPYELIVDGAHRELGEKAYLLSPQDLAAHDLIGDLTSIGVCSFKIEGRLKSAHYVAAATQTYRGAIDAAIAGAEFQASRQQVQDLAQSFSRGFTHGFLDGVDHQVLVHARFPKSRGIRAGRVIDRTPGGLVVELESDDGQCPLKPGDGVVLDEGHPEQNEQGGRVYAVVPAQRPASKNAKRTDTFEIQFERGGVNLLAVAIGAVVWKTDDPTMRRRLEQSYGRETVARRIPLRATVSAIVGQRLRIELAEPTGATANVEWDRVLEAAQKFPLTESVFREQFSRLGDTPFELGEVHGLEMPSGAMVPKSVLNDLRRRAVEQLAAQRASAGAVDVIEPAALDRVRAEIAETYVTSASAQASSSLHVMVRSLDQLRAVAGRQGALAGLAPSSAYCDFEDIRKYKEAVAIAKEAGVRIGLATIRIIKPGEEGLLKQIADCGADEVLIRNLTGLAWFAANAPGTPLVADYALNIANEVTAAIVAEQGVLRMTPSYDLNWTQLSSMLSRFPADRFEAVIHQHMPMFHMEHCVFCHTLSTGTSFRDCGRPCDEHRVDLKDRAGVAHPLIADVGCRNTVYNGTAQSAAEYVPKMRELGIRHFRVELLRETAEQVAPLLDRYAKVLAGEDDGRQAWRQLKVLNQLGVTRGTMRE